VARIEDRLRAFITAEHPSEVPADSLSDEYPLVENEVLDSMALLRLVEFIEAEFGIEIRDEELVLQNFGNIRDMTRFISSKVGPV
jgi:acyl carrier protein